MDGDHGDPWDENHHQKSPPLKGEYLSYFFQANILADRSQSSEVTSRAIATSVSTFPADQLVLLFVVFLERSLSENRVRYPWPLAEFFNVFDSTRGFPGEGPFFHWPSLFFVLPVATAIDAGVRVNGWQPITAGSKPRWRSRMEHRQYSWSIRSTGEHKESTFYALKNSFLLLMS